MAFQVSRVGVLDTLGLLTAPLTLPLPQIAQRQAIRGEEKIRGTLTPGRREGDGGPVAPAPRLPWDILVPLQGSQDEAAASCRCTSLKIPSAGRGAMLEKPSPQRQRSRSTGVGRYPLPNPP